MSSSKKGQVSRPVPFFILISVFFFSSPLFAESILSHPGENHFQSGVTAMNEGALDEAEQEFEEALLREPMNSEYRFELANLYAMRHDEFLEIKDEEGALEKLQSSASQLEQAVMAKPDFVAAQFNLGVVYKRLGKYEAARRQFKKVLEIDPTQGQATLQIGATYEEQGFYDEAETIYHELLEKYPNHAALQEALQGLAQRREQARRSEMAERGAHMSALNSGLSALSRGSSATDPYGYQNQNSNAQGALPYLGSWALQQFMKRKSTTA